MCLASACIPAAAWQPSSLALNALSRRPPTLALDTLRRRPSPRACPPTRARHPNTVPAAAAAAAADCDPYDPSSIEFCSPEVQEAGSLRRTLKLTTYFTLWYALNIGYNIYNKKFLNAVPLPWTAATVQLFAGIPYVALLWATGLRRAPRLSVGDLRTLSSSAFVTTAGHVGGVISFGAGAISFTHIVKATEPVLSALITAVFFREFLPLPVYASMLPIVGGVALASLKELSFSWWSFATALASAVASASKSILSKKVLDGKPLGENLTPTNMYAVLTILGFFMILPVSLALEPPAAIRAAWSAALAAGHAAPRLAGLLAASGAFYYLYNEVAFLALSEVAPVTHAVGNTVKRVVIILASVVVFHTPITGLGALGSAIAILGTLLYSLAKGKYK